MEPMHVASERDPGDARDPGDPRRGTATTGRAGPPAGRGPRARGGPTRRAGRRGFWRGAGEAAAIVALFVAGGLGWAEVLAPTPPGSRPARYPDPVPADPARPASADEPRLWLVDGYNVLSVGLLAGRSRERWWEAEGREELLRRVAGFPVPEAEVWVVFDGPHPVEAPPEARVRPVFAPDADAWLLDRIRAERPTPVALVTADRRLAARARSRGARVVAPAAFLARCCETGSG